VARKPASKGRKAVASKATQERKDPSHRRQEILDAALDLFADRGFQGTSVRDIARAVGVNEATLYHYFPSKAAILDANLDVLLEERREVFAVADDPKVPLDEVLYALTMRALAQLHAPREQQLVRMMMIEGPRLAVLGRYPFLRVMHESGERVNRVFETLIATGRMRRRDTRLIALQFLSPIFIYGFHQHGLGGRTKEPINEAAFARAHVELFTCALAP
jgi:AcrR family transcriptional regulator